MFYLLIIDGIEVTPQLFPRTHARAKKYIIIFMSSRVINIMAKITMTMMITIGMMMMIFFSQSSILKGKSGETGSKGKLSVRRMSVYTHTDIGNSQYHHHHHQ